MCDSLNLLKEKYYRMPSNSTFTSQDLQKDLGLSLVRIQNITDSTDFREIAKLIFNKLCEKKN